MKERDKRHGLLVLLTVHCFIFLVPAYDPATCIQCRKSHVCNPPDCFCCRDEMPLHDQKIPQMVFFTFDDAVNPQVAAFYKELFDASRVNPNGCPIKMTLFISHSSTVYSLVNEFYQKGMEIASHSVTHSNPDPNTFLHEAKKQKENLVLKAKIPENEIKGWRSPFLKPLGDKQPDVLQELGYEYDATLTIIKPNAKEKAPIPFTLDYGWPYDCKIQPCPKKEHKGFWEVPVISVRDYLDKYNCVYIDGCNIPPPSEALAYQFLWDNFENYYKTNRAPMGINMHASWFYYPDRKKAMNRFIKDLIELGDVYIVSVSQVIAWLRNPTPLSGIKDFAPWQCNGNNTATSSGTVDLRTQIDKQRQLNRLLQNQRALVKPQPTRPPGPKTRQNTLPSSQNKVFTRTLQTGATQRTLAPTHYLQGLQNALIIRPAQQGNVNMRPVQANVRQGIIHIRPEVQQRISNVIPSQVPLFPWTRQQFLPQGQDMLQQPPIATNYPVVRFWWRPPEMQLPNQRPSIHVIRPEQRIVSQEDIMQQNMRTYQELERKRQLAEQQALERRQREERMRQEELKRQQELQRLHELQQQKEILQKQELERQKVARLKRKEELKRQQEAEIKRKLLQQNELEKQRLLEMKRQQELEKLRIEKPRKQKKERKQQTELLPKAAESQESLKQSHINQLFAWNSNKNKPISKQQESESHKIEQLKQLAETNFLKLQEMEKQRNSLQTTTATTRRAPKLRGRAMWQMDLSALRQINAPWQNWITERPPHNKVLGMHGIQLSEFNVEPVKKITVTANKSEERVATFTSFKPQTVFSISDFNGPKSFSIFDNVKYSNKDPAEPIQQSHGIQLTAARPFKSMSPKTPPHTLTESQTTTKVTVATTPRKSITDQSIEESSTVETTTSMPESTISVQHTKYLSETKKMKPEDVQRNATLKSSIQAQSNNSSIDRAEIKQSISLTGRCVAGKNCKLPECLCKSISPPNGVRPENVPQVVYITVDGSIDFHSYSNMKKIFEKKRINPNGCPIKGTVFATDSNSNSLITKMLHADGFEIAMKGLNGGAFQSAETLEKDIHTQKKQLVKNANIPFTDIKGWRSPDLKPLGDKQFEILSNTSLYDSTLIVGKDSHNEQNLWPFTLDYGWREKCEIEQCPTGIHPGVWEVPIIPVLELNNSRACVYADSCTNQPANEEETVGFLMDNFNKYYKTNRAPFAIRLQQVWFHWHYSKNLSGLVQFLDEILKLGDVYVVTVNKMLEWIKSPTSLNKITGFQPWSC